MEGIFEKACSIVGHYGIGELIIFYDDNRISIDGETKISFAMDMRA